MKPAKMLHICIICGTDHWVNKQASRQKYCPKCKEDQEVEKRKEWLEEARLKRIADKGKPACSCGCGKPIGKKLKLLSTYCYKKRTNNILDENPNRW